MVAVDYLIATLTTTNLGIRNGGICWIFSMIKNGMYFQISCLFLVLFCLGSIPVSSCPLNPNWHDGRYFLDQILSTDFWWKLTSIGLIWNHVKLIESYKNAPYVALKMSIFLAFIAHANESWFNVSSCIFVLSRSCNNLNFFRFIPNVIGAIAEKMLPGDEWFDFFTGIFEQFSIQLCLVL